VASAYRTPTACGLALSGGDALTDRYASAGHGPFTSFGVDPTVAASIEYNALAGCRSCTFDDPGTFYGTGALHGALALDVSLGFCRNGVYRHHQGGSQ